MTKKRREEAVQYGRQGGMQTFKKYGSSYFSKIARKRWKNHKKG